MTEAERPDPFALIFGDEFDETFTRLHAEVEARGGATVGELLALPAAGEVLRRLVPEGAGEEHRALLSEVAALLFHAFRFWLHGRVIHRFTDEAARALITEQRAEWRFRTPAAAGYVQLPRNLFWARAEADAAPEPVDGFFWSSPEETEGAPQPRLDLLLVLGLRAGRPGVTVVGVGLEPGGDIAQWADVDARGDGADFANVLPGGELQDYHALTTRAEALKLAVRALRRIDTGAVEKHDVVHLVSG